MLRWGWGVGAVIVLAVASTMVGVSDVPLSAWWPWSADAEAREILWVSRFPRTVALVLAGTAMAVSGLLMQLLVRNRFVEPSTVGTTEAAGFGLVVITLLAPGAPIIVKMVAAAIAALVGTWLFLRVVRVLPVHNTVLVPVVGLMLGGVIAAMTTFLAYRFDLLQSLNTWMTGDFSGVLRGRYELLWVVGALTALAYVAADRFTVAGLGESFATNVGLAHGRVLATGLGLVSVVSAVTVVTVGVIPFLGLVVPNLVSAVLGDNARRSIPWVALVGAGLVLVCDLVGRLVRYPYEIPIGTVMGVVGAAFFLVILLRTRSDHVAA